MINLFAIAGLCAICGISSTNALNVQSENISYGVNENIEFHQDNKLNVVYDDENYKITLTADELNNYHFDNLCNYLSDNFTNFTTIGPTSGSTYGSYSNSYVPLQAHVSNSTTPYLAVSFGTPGSQIVCGFNGSSNFTILYGNDNFSLPFDNSLILTFADTYYDDFKQVIELDMQANIPVEPINAFPSIISTLVGGISGFASGLGAGVSNLVSNIFVDNGGLSVFGYMVVIFAGISLAIGLSRWIMNFLTSLGAKK